MPTLGSAERRHATRPSALISLSHVGQVQRLPVAPEDLAAQAGVVGEGEAGVGAHQGLGVAAGLFQDLSVASQVRDAKRRQPVLARPKQLARTAQAEIDLRKAKAVGRGGEGLQAGLGLFGLRVGEHSAEGRQRAAADPPAKLVQLRQPEPLAAVDGHERGVG